MLSHIDKKLLLVIAILMLFGVVMIYSATSIMCAKRADIADSTFYLKKELIRVGIALAGLLAASQIDYKLYKRFAPLILGGAALMLVALTIPRFAAGSIKGANRWLDFGGASVQPSEFAKLAIIIFLAEYLSKKGPILDNFKKGFLPAAVVVIAIIGFVALQPNYGMAIAMSVVAVVMFFVAGVKIRHMAYVALPAIPLMTLAIMHSKHAHQRIVTFLYGGDPLGDAFQINQSLIAIGTGGILGKGIGHGVQKLFYLPEIHTDFIFAVIGEELGLLGTTVVLVLFLLFAWRGIKIAMRAPDNFGQYLAIGITSMVFIYAMLNLGVVLRMIPTTGIPLPFISYGGSALVITMISCGILLNISSHVQTPIEERIAILEDEPPMEGFDADFYGWRRNRRTSDTRAEHRTGIVSPSSGR